MYARNVLELTFTCAVSADTSSLSAVKITIMRVLIAEEKVSDLMMFTNT